MPVVDVGSIVSSFKIKDLDRQLRMLEQVERKIDRLDGRRIEVRSAGIDQTASSVQRLGNGLKLLTSPLTNTVGLFNGVRRSALGFADQITHLGQVAAATSFRLQLLLAPVQAFAGLTAKTVVDLEHGLSIIGTQTELSGNQLEEFLGLAQDQMQETSITWGVAQSDMQAALFNLISSFEVDAPAALLPLLDIVGKFAVLGDTTAESVSELGVVLLSSFADPAVLRDATQLPELLSTQLSQVFLAMREGRGTFQEFVQQIGDFARIGQQVGATLPELLGLFTVLTRTRPISESATQVKRLLQSLVEERTQDGLEGLGISLTQFVEGQENIGKFVPRSSLVTQKQRERLAELNVEYQNQIDKIKATEIRLSKAKAGSAALADQQRILRNRTAELAEIEAERDAILSKVNDTTQIFVQTGERELRRPFEILTDLFVKLRTLDPADRLTTLEDVFPNIRAELGALEFQQFAEDIVRLAESFDETSDSFKNAVQVMDEQADFVNQTVTQKIRRLFETIVALGQDVFEDVSVRIKGSIDLIQEAFQAIRNLPDETRGRIVELLTVISLLPPAMLALSVAILGAGGLVSAIGTLASPALIGTVALLFSTFQTELMLLRDAARDFDLTTLDGLVNFLAQLGQAAGLVTPEQVERIFEALDISPQSPESIQKINEAFKGIGETVASTKDFIKDWVDAFGEFFDMIERREGLVGNLLQILEGVGGVITRVPTLEGGTAESRARLIDVGVAGFLGFPILKEIAKSLAGGVVARVVNVAGGVVNVTGPASGRGLFPGPATAGRGGAAVAGGGILASIRGLFATGPLAALTGIATLLRGSQAQPSDMRLELERTLVRAENQGVTLSEVPGISELLDEFGASGVTQEEQLRILMDIRDLLGQPLAEGPMSTPDIAFLQSMIGQAQRQPSAAAASFDRALLQREADRRQVDLARRAEEAASFDRVLMTRFGFTGLPTTGAEQNLSPVLQQLSDLLMQLSQQGIDLSETGIVTLVNQFQEADTSRQQEILQQLRDMLQESAQRQESTINRLTGAVMGLVGKLRTVSSVGEFANERLPLTGPRLFHTGGFIDMLQSEFVTSPLTTRILEGVVGGPLTQNNLRQFAISQSNMQMQSVSIDAGKPMRIELNATGMGNFSLSAAQKEELGWEITGLVASRIQEAFNAS